MESSSEFEHNQDRIESQQVYREPKKQMNYEISANSGPWTEKQNMKYIVFVDKNRDSLASRSKRRMRKIFKEMSSFLGTRNSIQCRSHHQKQLDKLKNISKIIEVFRKNFKDEENTEKVEEGNSLSFEGNFSISDGSNKKKLVENEIGSREKNVQVQTQLAGVELELKVQQKTAQIHGNSSINQEFSNLIAFSQMLHYYSNAIGFNPYWVYQFPVKEY